MLKIERLLDGAMQAIQAGDKVTASRLIAEASAAKEEAKRFAERAGSQ